MVLCAGTWVYVAEREVGTVPFFADMNFSHHAPSVFGALGGSLPTFAHAFAFSIFTALILGPTRRTALSACLTWFFIGVCFEIGQHTAIAPSLASVLSPFGSLSSYFLAGTFDLFDLASIVIGAALAYIFLSVSFMPRQSPST
jgi:hypothetical protein